MGLTPYPSSISQAQAKVFLDEVLPADSLDSLSIQSTGTHTSLSCFYSPELTCGESLEYSSPNQTPAAFVFNSTPAPSFDSNELSSLIR